CLYCQPPHTICSCCWARAFEQVAGPQVSALLRLAWVLCRDVDPTSFLQAGRAFKNDLARIQIEALRAAAQPSLDGGVAAEAAIWRPFFDAVRAYKRRVSLDAPALEFLSCLNNAIRQRRQQRRLLRSVGVDVQRLTWRSRQARSEGEKQAIVQYILG